MVSFRVTICFRPESKMLSVNSSVFCPFGTWSVRAASGNSAKFSSSR